MKKAGQYNQDKRKLPLHFTTTFYYILNLSISTDKMPAQETRPKH
jgi:hypothetical protein